MIGDEQTLFPDNEGLLEATRVLVKEGFIVLPSTAAHGAVSRIVPQFAAGEVVTNSKNTVDKVVTEYGVAELRSKSVRERATALIGIAHPAHRDHLTAEAKRLGHL